LQNATLKYDFVYLNLATADSRIGRERMNEMHNFNEGVYSVAHFSVCLSVTPDDRVFKSIENRENSDLQLATKHR